MGRQVLGDRIVRVWGVLLPCGEPGPHTLLSVPVRKKMPRRKQTHVIDKLFVQQCDMFRNTQMHPARIAAAQALPLQWDREHR